VIKRERSVNDVKMSKLIYVAYASCVRNYRLRKKIYFPVPATGIAVWNSLT
jgi:hypothetical protein